MRALRVLVATLLLVGVFSAPLTQADESATTTDSGATTTATSTDPVTESVASTTETATSSEVSTPVPLPTGVLLDHSSADEAWSLAVGTGGHYTYFFNGYDALGNPPTLATQHAWVSTGTTTTARVQPFGDTTCDQLRWGDTRGINVYTSTYNVYSSAGVVSREGGKFCDFYFQGDGIPAGTPLSVIVLGVSGTVLGSATNAGTSLNGSYQDPVLGGFAFQLCGVSGCSGGFASSTPVVVTPPGPTISNVLFLPGIKGSRLYDDDIDCGVISCDNRLWDPGSSEDIQSLFLNPFGESAQTGVYTNEGDVIDKVDKKYYDSFIKDMNELQASSTYNGGDFEWRAAAYDWRLSLDDIITNGAKHDEKIYYEEATSTPYIEQTLRELAGKSTTGKVTIIAHSNGGLVTKALLSKLGSEETARLVDKIIFVGVPQTGAPQALGGLLFGEGEGLPKDKLPFIVSLATARTLAESSPMAYHLMPSARYLSDVQDSSHSIIGFSGKILYPKERSFYGPSIDTLTELDNFLLAVDGGRSKPDVTDSSSANVLNSFLIAYANSTHAAIDAWVPPASVILYQIAGWGADTISGIDFYDEQKLLGVNVGYKKQYRPIFVEDGDGVVPVPSALMMSAGENVKRYWIDLLEAKKDHGTMLEDTGLRLFLTNILTGSADSLPALISTTQPESNPSSKKLVFQLHSPLTLGLYDSSGNFTGLNPDGSVSESIPGAEYGEFGEVKYLIAPAGQAYQLVMLGQSEGTFSLDIQEQTGNTVTSSATIADVPTTASTIAKLTITNGVADASGLQVDTDGNGTTDTSLSAQAGETVNYTPSVSAASGSISGSSSGSTPTTTTSTVVTAALAPFIPTAKLITNLPAVVKTALTRAAPAGAVATTSQAQIVASTSIPELPQTASAYSAFSFVTEWLQELMYTLWQGFAKFLEVISNGI